MNVINLTPHTVRLITADGETSFESAGVARVATKMVEVGRESGAPINKVEYGTIEGLPFHKTGTIYIVSMVVAQAAPHRKDLICPNTAPSEVVRDESGQIYGVKSWAAYWQ